MGIEKNNVFLCMCGSDEGPPAAPAQPGAGRPAGRPPRGVLVPPIHHQPDEEQSLHPAAHQLWCAQATHSYNAFNNE